MLLNTSSKSYPGDRLATSLSQPRLAKMGVSYRPINTRSNWPLPVDTSVVTRWRKTFSSSTTQLSLMSGFCASNLGESFLSSIIAGLLTAPIVTVFCWARTLTPVIRVAKRENAKCFIFIIWMSCGLGTLADVALGLIAPASSTWVHGFDGVPDPTHDPEEGVNLD